MWSALNERRYLVKQLPAWCRELLLSPRANDCVNRRHFQWSQWRRRRQRWRGCSMALLQASKSDQNQSSMCNFHFHVYWISTPSSSSSELFSNVRERKEDSLSLSLSLFQLSFLLSCFPNGTDGFKMRLTICEIETQLLDKT